MSLRSSWAISRCSAILSCSCNIFVCCSSWLVLLRYPARFHSQQIARRRDSCPGSASASPRPCWSSAPRPCWSSARPRMWPGSVGSGPAACTKGPDFAGRALALRDACAGRFIGEIGLARSAASATLTVFFLICLRPVRLRKSFRPLSSQDLCSADPRRSVSLICLRPVRRRASFRHLSSQDLWSFPRITIWWAPIASPWQFHARA